MDTSDILRPVLNDTRVLAVKEIFDRYDNEANIAQMAFRKFSLIFILATALATLAAALILFGSGVQSTDGAHPAAVFVKRDAVQSLLFMLQIGALAVAAFAAHVQEDRQHMNRWGQKRHLAEDARIELFDTIFNVSKDGSSEGQIASFDYFLSEQLDGQISYFDKAHNKHDTSASRLAIFGAVAAAVVAAAGASGYSEYWLPLAALAGVVAPIFLTGVNSWRDTGKDQQKAARYTEVWSKLVKLKGQSGMAKEKLAMGDVAAADGFIADVHKVLRTELATWIKDLPEREAD